MILFSNIFVYKTQLSARKDKDVLGISKISSTYASTLRSWMSEVAEIFIIFLFADTTPHEPFTFILACERQDVNRMLSRSGNSDLF